MFLWVAAHLYFVCQFEINTAGRDNDVSFFEGNPFLHVSAFIAPRSVIWAAAHSCLVALQSPRALGGAEPTGSKIILMKYY
eukprot:scaffold599357_cov20-Prasinocladus_malaysianus.AAC.1